MALLTGLLAVALSASATAFSGQQGSTAKMLEHYSTRAKQILLFARIQAGKDGAHEVRLQHLIEAIIIQDQGLAEITKLLGYAPTTLQVTGHTLELTEKPFFAAGLATVLLSELDSLYPHSSPVESSFDMPVSNEVARALQLAQQRAKDAGRQTIEPLDILAAALSNQNNKAAQVLIQAGVTEDNVIKASH